MMMMTKLCYTYVAVQICNYIDLKNDHLLYFLAAKLMQFQFEKVFSRLLYFFIVFSLSSLSIFFTNFLEFNLLLNEVFHTKILFNEIYSNLHLKNVKIRTYRSVCKLLELTVRSRISPQYFSESVS